MQSHVSPGVNLRLAPNQSAVVEMPLPTVVQIAGPELLQQQFAETRSCGGERKDMYKQNISKWNKTRPQQALEPLCGAASVWDALKQLCAAEVKLHSRSKIAPSRVSLQPITIRKRLVALELSHPYQTPCLHQQLVTIRR